MTTTDEYIAGFPPDIQAILQKVRATIRNAAPGAKETISYQMPTFVLEGNLVHFAAFQSHIGLYPTPSGTERFREELSKYHTGKGSIQVSPGQTDPLRPHHPDREVQGEGEPGAGGRQEEGRPFRGPDEDCQ